MNKGIANRNSDIIHCNPDYYPMHKGIILILVIVVTCERSKAVISLLNRHEKLAENRNSTLSLANTDIGDINCKAIYIKSHFALFEIHSYIQ